jgi:hypothetical protein
MGAQPEELEREIARTRADLGRTLDELEHKLSPRRMVDDNRQKINIALAAMAALMAIIAGRKVVRARRSRG